MKKILILPILLVLSLQLRSQTLTTNEKFGNTLNLGVGIGYYGYIGHNIPVLSVNYEIDVAPYFTLAPFIGFFNYQNNYYWGNPNYPYRYYNYHQTVVPVGVKACYYFDKLLKANSKWDFYLAGSLGFEFRNTTWESGYYGEKVVRSNSSSLYLDGHIGTEYHLSSKAGLFLDLSTGVSTFGVSFHL